MYITNAVPLGQSYPITADQHGPCYHLSPPDLCILKGTRPSGNSNSNANSSSQARGPQSRRALRSHLDSQTAPGNDGTVLKDTEDDHNHLFGRLSDNEHSDYYSQVASVTPSKSRSIELAEIKRERERQGLEDQSYHERPE